MALGVAGFATGWYANLRYARLKGSIEKLRDVGGADWLLKQIKTGPTARGHLEEVLKLSKTVSQAG
jgi:hypothetical protein